MSSQSYHIRIVKISGIGEARNNFSSVIPGLYYFDDYIDKDVEAALVLSIHSHPHAWKTLNNRTLQNWGGLPHIKGMLPTKLPPFVEPLLEKLASDEIFPADSRPNHVLVNRYLPGQGIDAHVDGPAYRPVAAIVSLCAPILMHFYQRNQSSDAIPSQPVCSLLLRPRSLLVLSQHAYLHVYHAILPQEIDHVDDLTLNARSDELGTNIHRQERLSLTIRTACRTLQNPLLVKRPHGSRK